VFSRKERHVKLSVLSIEMTIAGERRDKGAEGVVEFEQNRTKHRTLRHTTWQIERSRFKVVTRGRE
jgi:hypothetical protein